MYRYDNEKSDDYTYQNRNTEKRMITERWVIYTCDNKKTADVHVCQRRAYNIHLR